MLSRNDNLYPERCEEYKTYNPEDLVMPASWALEDFEDILPDHKELEEALR